MKKTQSDALYGVLVAKGPTSTEVNTLIQKLIRRPGENLARVIDCLVRYLVDTETGKGLPVNAGVQTDELLLRAHRGAWGLVEDYTSQGGLLTARDYVTRSELQDAIYKRWVDTFREAIPVTISFAGLPEDELNDRACIATLNCRAALRELVVGFPEAYGDPNHVMVVRDEEALEYLCKKLVKAALEGFESPNETQHKLLHSAKTSES